MAKSKENPACGAGLPKDDLLGSIVNPECMKSHPKNQAFLVFNWRPVVKGTKVGTFDLTLPLNSDGPGLVIHGCMLHRHAAGKAWIAFPAREFVNPDKSIGFAKLFSFMDPRHSEKVKTEMLPVVLALEAECSR
jgi:hypothetical protein